MTNQIGNLIFGIILALLALGGFVLDAMHGSISLRGLALDGSLMLFAVSRFLMFGSPGLPVIRPLRTIALVGVIASYLIPKS
jgi:hypothetical protein